MATPTLEISFLIKNDNQIMRSHLVHGISILPGVVLLDMIYRLARKHLGSTDVALRNITYMTPIVTSEEFDQEVAIRFVESPDGSRSVGVQARKTRGGSASEEQAVEILDCQMVAEPAIATRPAFDLDAFIGGADRRWDMDETYAMVRKARIVHGEFMKALGTLYHKGGQALARLRLSAIAESYRERFMAHPVFLDAATSLPFSFRLAAPPADRDAPMDPYIPFSIQRFRIHHRLPAEVYVYSAGREERGGEQGKPDLVSTDIKIFDHRGGLLAEFERVAGKRIRAPRLIAKHVHDERPETMPSAAAAAVPREPIQVPEAAPKEVAPRELVTSRIREFLAERMSALLDGADEGLARDQVFYDLGLDSAHLLHLTKQLEERCGCRLYPTFLFEYKTIDEVADYLYDHHRAAFDAGPGRGAGDAPRTPPPVSQRTRTASGETGRLMLQPIWEKRAAAPLAGPGYRRRLVLIRAADEAALGLSRQPSVGELEVLSTDESCLSTAYSTCAARLVTCAQGIFEERSSGPTLLQVLFPDDERGRLLTGLVSLLRSAHLENPKIVGQVILFERGTDPAGLARRLADEAAAGTMGVVRYARGERHAKAWTEVFAAQPVIPWQDGATYLITGGAGGLGLKIAEEIASRARGTTLYLCGRSPLRPDAERALDRLRVLDCNVVYRRADVSRRQEVDDLIEAALRAPGPLKGILHAAGILRDRFLPRKEHRELSEVFAAKVDGTVHLDEATQGTALDVFLLFSAMAAFVGNAGQADYAAANAFMDHYASYREGLRARGGRQGQTLSINWPLWQDGGMRVDAAPEQGTSALHGMVPLQTAAGFEALYLALGSGLPQVAVAEGERSGLRTFFAARLGPAAGTPPVNEEPQPRVPTPPGQGPLDIAVIGLSGAYPEAVDLEEFWHNLASGRDCISEVPPDRWDWREYYTEDRQKPGHHHCKWGGFMKGVDQFDARFFNMSPREAEVIDPQERLFLEHAWRAMEDAGYRRQDLQRGAEDDLPGQVGVYVGVMFSEYPLFGAEASARGSRVGFASGMASVANRVSYFLNLHGPSMTVDTMCSGALTSLHLACQDLQSGRIELAFAGAVNVTIHPNKYLMLSAAQFIAPEGRCASFGVGGDGYVPGEGVGVAVLKRLADAERDGDHIHGVIKASALNHGGKATGFSVPNPKAQEVVILRALREAGVDPRTISYVEAHGTGTKLGDPIEITALTKAFNTEEKQFCWIGSAKSNIGHCESAAGIAGLTKVLLQMKTGKIAPSLHSGTLNPHIDFASTPFVVNQALRDWVRPVVDGTTQPRRAGVSSFGAGGSNAHVIVEEYPPPGAATDAADLATSERGPFMIVLSARSQEQVRAYARKLLVFLERESSRWLDLGDIAYTLQLGREAMEARLGLLVTSRQELLAALAGVVDGSRPGCPHFFGTAGGEKGRQATDGESTDSRIDRRDHGGILERWVNGEGVDWRRLHSGRTPRRLSLPTYPFKRARHWLPDKLLPNAASAPERPVFQMTGPTKKMSLGES